MITIIGGSGFYEFLDHPETRTVPTPYGDVMCEVGTKGGKDVSFIPRHGKTHSIAPHNINYRANIFAANQLQTEFILTTNAVGSTNRKLPPGNLAIPDQVLDFTNGRKNTFFDGSTEIIPISSGKALTGVVHTDVTSPFDTSVREMIKLQAKNADIPIHDGGTIAVFNGPRYETPAEIRAVSLLGADYVGMTSAPEAFLAKELLIPYATIAVITNFAAGMQSSISHAEVEEIFSHNIGLIKSLFYDIISAHD